MIYIANATRQNRVFYYRIPGESNVTGRSVLRGMDIPSGKQWAFGADWTRDQVDAFVKQIERAGGKRVADLINRKSDHGLHGLLYDMDVIEPDNIRIGNKEVLEFAHRRSAAEAEKAAAAVDMNLRDPDGKRRHKQLKATIEQDVPRSRAATADDVNMDLTIAEEGEPLRLPA